MKDIMSSKLLTAGVIALLLVAPIECEFNDYENEVLDFNQSNSRIEKYVCPSEGFHADPNDCRVFYRCVVFGGRTPLVPIKFECGTETVFSESRGFVCIDPNESGRPECGDINNDVESDLTQNTPETYDEIPLPLLPSPQTSSQFHRGTGKILRPRSNVNCVNEGFMEDPQDCEKFYRCVDQGNGKLEKFEFTCGIGTVWDQNILGCNHPWAVERPQCRQNAPGSHTDNLGQSPNVDINDNSGSGFQNPQNTVSQTGTGNFGNNINQGYPNNQPNSEYTQRPNINNVKPNSVPGPSYLPAIGSTNKPSPTNPALVAISPTNNNPPRGNNPGAPGTGGTPCGPGIVGSSDCSREGYFPNPEDCHKFYRCVQEESAFTRYDFVCGAGTAWDSRFETCNHENTVPNCGSNPQSQTTNNVNPNNSRPPNRYSQGFQSTNPTQRPQSTSPSYSTPGTGSTGYSPSGAPYPGSTISPQLSPNLPNPNNPTVSQNPSSGPSNLPNKPGPTYLPVNNQNNFDPNSVSQGISQSGAQGNKLPSGTGPNGISSQTSPSSGNGANTGSCQEEGFHPNPNDCRKFYRCVSNPPGFIRYDFDCGPGTAWDQGLLTCNYIAQVESCKGLNQTPDNGQSQPTQPNTGGTSSSPSPGPSSTSSQPPASPNDNQSNQPDATKNPPTASESPADVPTTTPNPVSNKDSSGNPSSSTPSTSDSSTSEKPEKDKDCNCDTKNKTVVCDGPGFYPHPTRCDKFYRCVDNGNGFNVYHFDCGPGTHFDPSINVCNYPESIYPARNCEGSGKQEEPSPNISTSEPSSPTDKSPQESTTVMPDSKQDSTTTTSMTTSSEGDTTPTDNETTTASDLTMTTVPTEDSSTDTASTDMTTEATTPGDTNTEKSTDNPEETTTSDSNTTPSGTTSAPDNLEASTMPSDTMTTTMSDNEMTTEAKSTDMDMMDTTTMASMSTQEPSEMTTMSSMPNETPMFNTPCPMLANLTDEQVVLVCPTGFKRHPKLCNLFYQCIPGEAMQIKISVLRCPEDTLFDEKKIQCLPEAETEPCMGTMAGKILQRRAVDNAVSPVKVPSKPLCPSEGHYPYRKGCSNAFYKCRKNSRNELQGYMYKCPENFVYWSVSRRCERISRLPMCAAMDDQSKEEINDWLNRWEIPIEDHNISSRSLFF